MSPASYRAAPPRAVYVLHAYVQRELYVSAHALALAGETNYVPRKSRQTLGLHHWELCAPSPWSR